MKPSALSFMFRHSLILAIMSVMVLGLTSCDLVIDEDNDNSKLIGTEWGSEDGTFAMAFEDLDWAFFYMENELIGSGQFEYNAAEGVITFDVFNVFSDDHEIFEGRPVKIVITDAEVSNNEMSVYFHELAEKEEYYIILFKK